MKLKKDKNNYSEEYVRKNRTFPVKNTVILVVLVIIQAVLVFFAVTYRPVPQDNIKNYIVEVETLSDGSLDITYTFLWEALDTSEELTWVEIGMANSDYTVYRDSVTANIVNFTQESYDGYVSLILDLDRAYMGGETLQFSFKINQKSMLCRDGSGYFYEFVPGWFNYTPVEQYEFRWKMTNGCVSAVCAEPDNGYYVWSGSFECGGYEIMQVRYADGSFDGAATVEYYPFDDSGTSNGLAGERLGLIIFVSLIIIVLIVVEVNIIDSYVSYDRGRGFLTGYGHYIHTYGRPNPRYIKERDKHATRSSGRGFGGGGGCACACACACAGGGRAGCNQKDTYGTEAVILKSFESN